MNRKLLNGLLAVAIAGAGCSGFTSCKDTGDDLQTRFDVQTATLQKKLDLLQAQANTIESTLNACKTECANKIADLLRRMGVAESDIETIKSQLAEKLDEDAVREIIESYGYLTKDDLPENFAQDIAEISGLMTDVDNLTSDYNNINTTVSGLVSTVEGYDEQLSDMTQTINVINQYYEEIIQKLENVGLTEEEVNQLIDVAIANLQSDLDQLSTDLTTNVSDLQRQINELKDKEDFDPTELENKITTLETRVSTLETTVQKISDLETQLSQIETRLSTTEQKAIDAYNKAVTNETKLTNIDNTLTTLIGQIGEWDDDTQTLAEAVKDLKTKYSDLNTKLESVDADLQAKYAELTGKDAELEDAINNLALDLDALTARVAANEEAIKALQEDVEKIFNRLDALITSVIVQGTYNPLFGNFALPIGVQSNMLVNYSGQSNNQTYEFPSVQSSATFNNENEITADELRMLQASGFAGGVSIENGAILINDNNANLGKVFVTINPNNINFTGKELKLVNSRDQESKVELRNLRRSEELLTFGYTYGRGGVNNGFYEADAYLPATEEAIGATAIRVNENLKSSMKEILKDRRSNLRSNLVSLMKAVYDEISGMLPAYGLKAAWDVDGKEYAVYSNYNLAATTFTPLSYGFLYDKSFSEVLPTIDPISEALFELNLKDLSFDFSDLGMTINPDDILKDIDFSVSDITVDPLDPSKFQCDLKGTTFTAVDEDGNETTFTITESTPVSLDTAGLQDFVDDLVEKINDQMGDVTGKVEDQLKDALTNLADQVNSQVENMLSKMESQINDKINDLVDDIKNQISNKAGSYIDKFNDFIKRYNSLANRLNGILENPNHYLQPTLLYNAGNGVHFLSGNVNRPTKFRNAGGNGVMLYATSYTGEIIAPAYKKFVACTNVIDNATGKTAQVDGGALLDDLKAVNNSEYMASVCPGNQHRFAVPTSSMKAGRTYEILYTAVDYHGVTSTTRCYLTIAD